VEGTSKAILGSSDQRNVPASLSLYLKSEEIPALLYVSLFLKSEEIPALICVGKGLEYTPFHDFRSVASGYRPGAQISNHGRAQALLIQFGFSFEF
jgi:hypothetical protein